MKLVSFTTGTGKGNGNMAESLIRARDGLHNVCCFQIHIWGFTHWPLAMQAYTCLSICKDTSLVPGNRLCYSSPVSLATICLIRLFTGLTEASPGSSGRQVCGRSWWFWMFFPYGYDLVKTPTDAASDLSHSEETIFGPPCLVHPDRITWVMGRLFFPD